MKSKHVAVYGKEIATSNTQSDFGNYHIIDNFVNKSTIAASDQVGYCKKVELWA